MGFKEFPEISESKYESIRIRFKWTTFNIPKDYMSYRLEEYVETSFDGQDIRSDESNAMGLKKYQPKKIQTSHYTNNIKIIIKNDLNVMTYTRNICKNT